jgi:peptidylprolyl isomerase
VLTAGLAAAVMLCGACASKSTASAGGTSQAPTGAPSATKPVVTVPEGPPPSKLVVRDLVVGTGAEATAGSSVTVQYVGVSWSTRKQFDASWDRGQPFPFTVGTGQVIPGWDQGVPGMRVGGRRELIIPPSLGYGAQGQPQAGIKPNETLVFVIDLVSVS